MAQFLEAFPDEKSCLEYVFYHRHGLNPRCPACGNATKFHLASYRRSFVSKCCGAFASPTAKTVLDHTKIPLRTWLYAFLLYTETSTGLSRNALGRIAGLTSSHAWSFADRIRTHIALSRRNEKLGGEGKPIYVDETQIHIGPLRKRHVLLGLTDGQRCLIRIVDDRSATSLVTPILEGVRAGSIIVSDGWPSYNLVEKYGFDHRRVVHLRKMWVNAHGDCMTYVEGLWAVLKRLIAGRAAHISSENLWKFVSEIMYRYDAALDPAQAWWRLISSFCTVGPDDLSKARLSIDRRLEARIQINNHAKTE